MRVSMEFIYYFPPFLFILHWAEIGVQAPQSLEVRLGQAEVISNSLGCHHVPTNILGRKYQKVEIKPRSNEVRALNSLNIPFLYWQNLSFKIAFLIWAIFFLVGPIPSSIFQKLGAVDSVFRLIFCFTSYLGWTMKIRRRLEEKPRMSFPFFHILDEPKSLQNFPFGHTASAMVFTHPGLWSLHFLL